MRFMLAVFVVPIILTLVACGVEKGTSQQVGIPTTPEANKAAPGRFTVVYQGTFKPGEGDYKSDSRRAIYTIIDNSTGQEYLGIEGVGVSQLHYNAATKHSTE